MNYCIHDIGNCCPICEGRNFSRHYVHDDRYGYPGNYTLLHCSACGHRFLQVNFTAENLKDMYSNYYPRANLSLENYIPYKKPNKLATWLDGEKHAPFLWTSPGTNVLDIGCGFGESLGYLQAYGCNAYGVEADENIRRVAEKFGFKVHIGLFDPAIYERNFFDYVTLGQVIEHVADPLQTIRDIARVLKPRGVAVLSTPNANGWGAWLFGKYWISWHAPYHLHFFTPKSINKLAAEAGLEVISIKTITPSVWLHCQWLHLITLPATGDSSIFWSMKGRWKPWQKLFRFAFAILHYLRFNHLVTRFFDFAGLGDNRLYFLRKP